MVSLLLCHFNCSLHEIWTSSLPHSHVTS